MEAALSGGQTRAKKHLVYIALFIGLEIAVMMDSITTSKYKEVFVIE